ncbi:uncharacterized protein MYCFIDRAFT_79241 [Pseudocercospora fijiensis CIRAD86]|uniref:Uncharacterized protein n=1 Tax=Pseudocercospora fijiensis (strain CIRAD86) TaxID=383855 RepID=M3A0R6_PSEFD|nr:uncharacterized protein MYCFIDRAFT_79241 [Pseudocercospora fijiensis CIRAD86]EME78001.1 hypothetical protein MYCFIDRAFT_79241 [Pseudocercospora fijiensis CIRAD86]
MLFKYPAPGICMSGSACSWPTLIARCDSPDALRDVMNWNEVDFEWTRWIHPEPIGETLAILRTGKQICEEALPMFYGLNNFFFEDHRITGLLAKTLPPSRAKFFKNIHIQLVRLDRDGKAFEDSFDTLSKLSLDKLTSSMSKDTERCWLSDFQGRGKGLWTENKFYRRRL